VLLCWRQPPRRTRQELPTAVLFLPDLHDADFGIGDFAVELAFRDPKMSHDGIVPDDLDRGSSGHSSDLKVAFRVIAPLMNLLLSSR
jgi:hypothetical protein